MAPASLSTVKLQSASYAERKNESTPRARVPSPPLAARRPSPAVLKVLGLFRLHHRGQLPNALHRVWLRPDEYWELQDELRKDRRLWGWVEDKVRYDYGSASQEFFIRMPTCIHELLMKKVELSILSQLDRIGKTSTPAVRTLVNEIASCASTDLYLEHQSGDDVGFAKRSPDGQFQHGQEKFPTVVLEVSYSQQRKDLVQLADDYIIGSRAGVGVVIGFDLEYRNSKEARVMLWRPKMITQDGSQYCKSEQTMSAVFRTASGQSASGDLRLQLRDFALPDKFHALPAPLQDTAVSIPFRELTEYLRFAEMRDQVRRAEPVRRRLGPDVRFLKRKRTPPEELESSDEAQFQNDEDSSERRVEREDRTWTGRASDVGDPNWERRLRPRREGGSLG